MTDTTEAPRQQPATSFRRDGRSRKLAIFAAVSGNVLEWYELSAYALFSVSIAKAYFPAANPATSMFVTLGTFAITFLLRPVGAAIMGAYADRVGRKKALLLSIWLMAGGTAVIAFTPTYGSIGMVAPILVLLARVAQAVSAGGEWGSAVAMLTEQGGGRRGLMGSLQFASQGLAVALAGLAGYILTSSMSSSEIDSWGWRIPFIVGLLIAPVGMIIRRQVDESPEYVAAQAARSTLDTEGALKVVAREQKLRVLLGMCTVALSTSINFIILAIPTYAVTTLKLHAGESYGATALDGLVLLLLTPLVGYASDKVGRIKLMTTTAIISAASVIPLYLWLDNNRTAATLLMVTLLLALLKASYFGSLPALLAETFPVQTRGTGLSLSFNFAVALFGGFTPIVTTALVVWTGSAVAPGYFLLAMALISLIALRVMRRVLGSR